MKISSVVSPLAVLLIAGCGMADMNMEGGMAMDGGMSMDHDMTEPDAAAAGADAAGGGADAATADAATSKPATPQLLGVVKMAGSLHVSWRLNDTNLATVEVWRKKDAGAYAKAYTLTGAATSQHDTAASSQGTYCYHVRTTRAGVGSEISNEICGSP